MKIDAHQHYWEIPRAGTEKSEKGTGVMAEPYLPEQLKHLLAKAGIDKTIVVQSVASEKDTEFLLRLAGEEDTIAGVVGWLDLLADDFEERLNHYSANEKFIGIRPMIQDLPSNWMLQEKVIRHLKLLETKQFPLDLQANPRHLRYIIAMLEEIPNLRAAINHLAKPPIEQRKMEPWVSEMEQIAAYPNVMCKLSGMVPEKETDWSAKEILPYANAVLESFGTHRVMFGSDWPVCLNSASHQEVIDLFEFIIANKSPEERKAMYGENAVRFYRLKF